jgi:hypothetical protein
MYLILNQSKFHFILFETNFSIIPTYSPRSREWHLPVTFSSKGFVCLYHSPFVLRDPTINLPLFEGRTVCWRVQIVKYTIFFSLLFFMSLKHVFSSRYSFLKHFQFWKLVWNVTPCSLVHFWLDILIIIIFIDCNWAVTRWQWLFYMYTSVWSWLLINLHLDREGCLRST